MNLIDETQLFDVPDLKNEDLIVRLREKRPADPERGFVPAYVFDLVHAPSDNIIGELALRVGNTHNIVMYNAHIGYEVATNFRGHKYAVRAVKLILPLAKKHGLNPLWITCNPDNFASRKTCEHLGAEFIEIVPLPENSEMFQRGMREKCRYRLSLDNVQG